MNKLSYNRTLAWILLVAAVAGACLIGQLRKASFEAKKPTELLDVRYHQWIEDSTGMLSDATIETVSKYNAAWDNSYHATIAIATIPTLNGWQDGMDYGKTLGEKWGLSSRDMLLLLVKDGYWYAILGNDVQDTVQQNKQEEKLESAMSNPYYKGNYDEAVIAFFRQADIYYAQASQYFYSSVSPGLGEYHSPNESGISLFGVLLLIVGIFIVWALLDRVRYNRYRRRTVVVGAPRVTYYPIFWGRHAAPPRHAPPPPGGYRPPHPTPPGPPRSSGSYRGGNTGRGGFGGKKR
ncbi:MAG: TPM domain-containing protein [Oscillospiraceae bacterium]|nr:TPM domain-containing protein [Oscillospiraceae bacterium]